MLDLDYIKENTLWVIKLYPGGRVTCKGSALNEYLKTNENSIDEYDTVTWQGQPKELQEFWKAYEYANYYQNRHDLYYIDDFYKEWIKNPNQFTADHRRVISTLNKELENLGNNDKLNVMITNYDKKGIGNHYLKNWLDTMKQMNEDFDVVEVNVGNDTIHIIVQIDDEELVEKLSYLSNKFACESIFKD